MNTFDHFLSVKSQRRKQLGRHPSSQVHKVVTMRLGKEVPVDKLNKREEYKLEYLRKHEAGV